MAGLNEQANGSGIGKSAVSVLLLVTMLCMCLIGAAGYVKFQLDRAEYNLSEVADAQATASSESVQINHQQAELLKQKQQANRDLRQWSLILTLIAWVSVIIAASLTISLYIVLQRRHAPALRALAQSIANLSRGDMQTPIWGMERSDAVGELARAVDLARYHFSQLPDMSIMSEQGPVRIKFEGGARSIFEAMMQQITSQTARIGDEAADLASASASHHKLMSELPIRMSAAIEQLQRNDRTNNQIIQRVSQGMEGAFEQLEQIVPFMQKRAQGMAEVTQIAGSQVASTLKNLAESEKLMRESTSKSQQTVEKLAGSTKELGERIFAALNLLQASGKVLDETTETSQSRLKELVEILGNSGNKLTQVVERVEKRLDNTSKAEESLALLADRTENSTVRMDGVIKSIEDRHDKLSEQIVLATERLDSIIASFTGAQRAMSDALQGISHDGGMLNNMFLELKNSNEQVLAKLSRTSQTGHEVVQHLAECSQKLLQQLQDHMVTQTKDAQEQLAEIARQNNELSSKTETASEAISSAVNTLEETKTKFNDIQASFADTLGSIGNKIEDQVATAFGKTEQVATQNYDKLSVLNNSVDQALQRLNVLSQLTGTLGTVAGQLGQLIPSLTASGNINAKADPSEIALVEAPKVDVSAVSEKLLSEFEEHWRSSIDQIDSVRDDLASMIEQQKDHLEMRLVILDKQIKALPSNIEADPKQIALLQDIISTLETMNYHLSQSEAAYSNNAENGDIMAV